MWQQTPIWHEGEGTWQEGESTWQEGEGTWQEGESTWQEGESTWQEGENAMKQAGNVVMPPTKRSKGAGGNAVGETTPGSGVGEVRFVDAESAQKALKALQSKPLQGSSLSLMLDPTSHDGTKLLVQGLPEGIEWQELKDHFAEIGNIAFVEIKGGNRKGPGRMGEVRFETPDGAAQAISLLHGSQFGTDTISVSLDPRCKDATRVLVHGLPPGTGWQELKERFSVVGTPIAYTGLKARSATEVPQMGEVRFEDPSHARMAVQALNGSMMLGSQIYVALDATSKDSSKVIVSNIPPGGSWQDLKDHFNQAGMSVAFVKMIPSGAAGKGGMVGGPWARVGEVRYEDPNHATLAMQQLNGSFIMDSQIFLSYDPSSPDRTRVLVTGIPPQVQWQELKDHFKTVGTVAHASVGGDWKNRDKAGGMGKGGGMVPMVNMVPMAGMSPMAMGKMAPMANMAPITNMVPYMNGGVMWVPMTVVPQQGVQKGWGKGGFSNKHVGKGR